MKLTLTEDDGTVLQAWTTDHEPDHDAFAAIMDHLDDTDTASDLDAVLSAALDRAGRSYGRTVSDREDFGADR